MMESRHMNEIRQALQHKMDDFAERVEWLEDGFDKKLIPASMEQAAADDIVSMQKAIKMIREMLAKTEAQESIEANEPIEGYLIRI